MNCLIVVSHPDDEVLGAGATICKLSREGNNVAVCILSGKAEARANKSDTLDEENKSVMNLLGVKKLYTADFPNMKLNTVPHLDLVKFIESCVIDFGAETVITHHPSDINDDHVKTSFATQAAVRVFQRKSGIIPLSELLYMETPSSTEWSLDTSARRFVPNTFFELGKEFLDIKLQALGTYKGVMREYPHPRSVDGICGLAAFRGSQCGCKYAEAFECAFRRIPK